MKYFIGVDLGGTNVRSLLVDENGNVISEVKGTTEREFGPDYVTNKIIKQIESLDYSAIGGIENISGIGIGVPGPVDVEKGSMVMASNLPGFENYPICSYLENRFHKPTYIDNDANVAGLAEAILGAGKEYSTVYYVTISTGVGGAFIVNKKLVSGGRGHAGEVGNMIVRPGGYKQGALNAGAVEGVASGTALTRRGKELIGEDKVHHAGNIFDLAAEGNENAQIIVNEFIEDMSTMFANIAHTVDPHCFVIGGGVMKSKRYFFDQLNRQFNNKIHVGMRGHIPLLETQIEDCGAIGAAMLPMSHLNDNE